MNGPWPDPLESMRPLAQSIGGVDEVDRVRRGMWIWATTPRPPVGCSPHTIIHRQNKLVVRFYAPPAGSPARDPVAVVPSLINRAYVCDLEADRSLCAGLAALGHPVYLVDWGVPGDEDAEDDVGRVVLELLHRSIDRICRHARRPKAFVLGYCQGGTISTIYAALRPEHVKGLITLNAPVQFSAGGRFRSFVDPSHFDVNQSVRPDALVPVSLMASAFKFLDPMGNWNKYLGIEAASHKPRELQRVMARERWLEENVPMPGAFAREFIQNAYQEDRLMAGTWKIRGETVNLRSITCPLMVVACDKDFITPPEAALPLLDAVSSTDKDKQLLKIGHIGVVVGSFGPKVFYPLLDRWFRRLAP